MTDSRSVGGRYSENEILAFNTNNNNNTSASIRIGGTGQFGVYVHNDTGAHTNHVITVQVSVNNMKFFDTPYTVTGLGYVDCDSMAQYMRVKVTTVQGGLSTCDVIVTRKKDG